MLLSSRLTLTMLSRLSLRKRLYVLGFSIVCPLPFWRGVFVWFSSLNCYVFVTFLLRFCCVGCVILSCYVIISLLHLSLCHVILSGSDCHRVMLLCQLFCVVLHPKTLNIND